MKRCYDILNKFTFVFILWLSVLTILTFCNDTRKEFEKNPWESTIFFVLQLPLYSLVIFGCYAMISIGWHLLTLSKFNLNN